MKSATLAVIAAAAIALGTSGAATAQTAVPANFDIKGFSLGQEMAGCPAGFHSSTDGALSACESTSETLAGKPVELFFIAGYKGKIVAVGAAGLNNPMEVANALSIKFGTPTESKDSVKEYTWRKGKTALTIDAFSDTHGTVILKDFVALEAANKDNAVAAQSDL